VLNVFFDNSIITSEHENTARREHRVTNTFCVSEDNHICRNTTIKIHRLKTGYKMV